MAIPRLPEFDPELTPEKRLQEQEAFLREFLSSFLRLYDKKLHLEGGGELMLSVLCGDLSGRKVDANDKKQWLSDVRALQAAVRDEEKHAEHLGQLYGLTAFHDPKYSHVVKLQRDYLSALTSLMEWAQKNAEDRWEPDQISTLSPASVIESLRGAPWEMTYREIGLVRIAIEMWQRERRTFRKPKEVTLSRPFTEDDLNGAEQRIKQAGYDARVRAKKGAPGTESDAAG